MNYYNLLYSVALSAFFAFSPACAMDISTLGETSQNPADLARQEEKSGAHKKLLTQTPFSQFRKSINTWIPIHNSWRADPSTVDKAAIKTNHVEPTAQSLKALIKNLTNDSPLVKNSSIWALMNDSMALYLMQDPEEVKDIIFSTYFAQNPDKLCPELQSITQTINQNPQDKKDLLTLLAIKGKQADPLTKNLIDQISPLVAAEDIDFMNMRTIDRTISQICSQQTPEPDLFSSLPQEVPAEREKNISEKVIEIVEQSIPNRDKATQLNSLYTALLSTKPNERKELAIWLKKEDVIKSAYKKLKQKVKARVTSTEDFNSQFNDLNKSVLFSSGSSDIPERSPIEVFKSSYDYIIHNIDSLNNNDWLLENTKYILADNLERMMLFIHDYDLNPKEESAPYESYRCWLLTLIKNTIFSPGPLTEEQIGELKKQIVAVNKTTQASLEAKSKGNALYNSELGVNTYLAEENQPAEKIQPTTNVSQEQDITKLKEILKQQEEGLTHNLYDLKILKEYHATLKKYRNLVESPRQKNEIAKLIKTTNKKIKQINIIAPKKPKTLGKKSPKEVAAIQRSQKPQDPLKARVPFESNTEKQLPENIITDIKNRRDKMTESELESAIFFLEDILNNRPDKKSPDSQEIVALINDLYANKNAFQNIAQMTSEEYTSSIAPQTLTPAPKNSIKGQPFAIDHPTQIREELIPSIPTTPNQAIEEPVAITTPAALPMPSQRQQLPVKKKPSLQSAKPMPTIEQTSAVADKPAPQQIAYIADDTFNTLINSSLYINFPDDQSIVYLEKLIDALTQRNYISVAKQLENVYVEAKTIKNLTDKKKSDMRETIINVCNQLKPQPAITWTWWNPISWVTATTSWVFNSIKSLFTWVMGR